MSTDFAGNVSRIPVVWTLEVHLKVANTTQITALVDTNTGVVSEVFESPIYKLSQGSKPAFAYDYYTGTKTVQGLLATMNAPTYTTGDRNFQTDLVLNAVEYGANDNNLCDHRYTATSYWAKAGELWGYSTPYIVWSGTSNDCDSQATGVKNIPCHNYTFEIFTTSLGWTMSGEDTDNFAPFTAPTTGMNYLFFQNNDVNNGEFFENWITNKDWASDFPPTSLASIAQLSTDQGSTWTSWDSDAKQDTDCNHYPYSDTVITENLASGGSASWSLGTMASSYPGC
jgi:hypothetical protein